MALKVSGFGVGECLELAYVLFGTLAIRRVDMHEKVVLSHGWRVWGLGFGVWGLGFGVWGERIYRVRQQWGGVANVEGSVK